jgi:NAD(P)-dependent dehydrogenase (short-subunit alcohol dehydrogenase family)
MKLQNKTAIVTGAGAGLGKAICQLFATEGCKVMAADVHPERLDALKQSLQALGYTITTCTVDVANQSSVKAMIDQAMSTYGQIDVLVNNAGVMDNFEPVGECPDSTWNRVMNINLNGVYYAMNAAVPHMLKAGKGSIINVASIGGLFGARAGAAYTTSKHAVIGLSKNTGYMYAKLGIRCNAIAPGAMETQIAESMDMSKITPLVNERIMPGMALNPRSSNPTEVAQVALFLASDDSSFVNASVVTADGGWSAY